jgi:hypothetical protein
MSHIAKIISFIFLIIILPQSLYPYWGEDVFIDGQNYVSDPRINANGDTLHVVFQGGDPYVIYYSRSTDEGFNWTQSEVILSDSSHSMHFPSFVNIGDRLIVAAQKESEEILCIISPDGGMTWNEPFVLSEYRFRYVYYPNLAVQYPYVYCSMKGSINDTSRFVLVRSTDNGDTWDSGRIMFDSRSGTQPPELLAYGNSLILVYTNSIMATEEVVCRRSTDRGLTWGDEIVVSDADGYHSQWPRAAVNDNGDIIVTWFDYKYGSLYGTWGDILYRISNDAGTTWGDEGRLTYTQSSGAQSVVFYQDNIYIVYEDIRDQGNPDPNWELYFNWSYNSGLNWNSEERITHAIYQSATPDLVIGDDGGYLGLVWEDHRYHPDPYEAIMFKYGADFTEIVEDDNHEREQNDIPVSIYPNPFNPITNIEFELPKQLYVKLSIYNLLGQRIRTLVDESKPAGFWTVVWDGKDSGGNSVSSGIYFYTLDTDIGREVKKMTLIK